MNRLAALIVPVLLSLIYPVASFSIGTPVSGEIENRNAPFTVQAIHDDSDPTFVGMRVGIINGTTRPPATIGTILFDGAYDPTNSGPGEGQTYQNITVTIPLDFTPGPAVLSIAPVFEPPVSVLRVASVPIYVNQLVPVIPTQ